MVKVPALFSLKTDQGRLVAKLSADVEVLAAIRPHRRAAELADIREKDARVLLAEAKRGKCNNAR